MISLTYLRLVISKAAKKTPDEWADLLATKVVPALRAADLDHDGRLSIKEILSMIKALLIATIH